MASGKRIGWRELSGHLFVGSLASVVPFLMRLALGGAGVVVPPFTLFYPAILLAALYRGLWTALAATIVSTILADIWFFDPVGQLRLETFSDLVSVLLFFGISVSISVVGDRYRRQQRRVAMLEQERKLRSAELRIADISERSRLALEAAHLGTWSYELGSGAVVSDRYSREFFGFSEGDRPGASDFMERVSEEHRARLRAVGKGVIERGEGAEFSEELRLIWPDGSVHWVGCGGRLYREAEADGDGKLKLVGVCRDTTQKNLNDEALRESEARFRSVLEDSRDVIYRVNLRTRKYEYVSPSVEQVVGIPVAEIMEMEWQEVLATIHPEDQERVRKALEGLGRGETTVVEYRQLGQRSDYHWLSNQATVIADEAGRPLYRDGAIRDITEQKNAETALLRSTTLESVGRMAATMAHEINNPLAALVNLVFLAQEEKDLPEAARKHLEAADAELRRVAHITRRSLGFYREATAPGPVDAALVMESAAELLAHKAEARRAVVVRDEQGPAMLTAVAGELRQIVSNLLANSLDAIELEGSVRMRVRTRRLLGRGIVVRLTVSDNGSGIAAADRGRVYEPFFSTKGPVGTGLGLWVTQQLVEKHRGTVRLRTSTEGARRGTTFVVELPAGVRD